MAICFFKRIAVVSGGPSSAKDTRAPRRPAAAVNEVLPRNWRRFCLICIKEPSEFASRWAALM
jgi:hypothetical protein